MQMNPFISFCLYVAARVFVQYLKSRPKDTQIKASLQFLLSAMNAIKRKNPLTESFLVQLDVDLEGAGLENTAELRASVPLNAQRPSNTNSCQSGCPNTHDEDQRVPTYGDGGLASYNDPNSVSAAPAIPSAPAKGSTFGSYSMAGMTRQSHGMDGVGLGQFELQNRQQRSPGSQQSSGLSPRPFNPDMDTSPDGSGGNDRPTPNSSTQSQHNLSSHTSNSTYSPQNLQQQDLSNSNMSSSVNLFDQTGDPNNTFTTDFDMNTFTGTQQPSDQSSQPGFVMWDGDLTTADMHTGFTPGPSTGFTPGPMPTMNFDGAESGVHDNGGVLGGDMTGMNDLMNGWSEPEWNDILASMDTSQGGGWNTNVEHDMQQAAAYHERLAKKGLIPRQSGAFGR